MSKDTSRVAPGPSLILTCAAVRRKRANESYSPGDYEVCLSLRADVFSLPMWPSDFNLEPDRMVLQNVKQRMKLTATQVYSLNVFGKPVGRDNHTITALYAIPVALNDVSIGGYQFHNLADILENHSTRFHQNHRNMLCSLDEWLRDRHTIPFINLDLMFLCSREGEGVGGLVKAIIDNPLHIAKVRPPEDNLVISLNNPVFSVDHNLPADANATVA